MLLRTLALAVVTLAGTAIAQCGTNQLVNGPAVNNNSGAVGGAIYFQLNVLNPNGVSICGVSLNSTAAAGLPMSARVFRHTSLTDPFFLTSANVVAANWTQHCGLAGTTMGLNTLSPLTVISGTGTLDLPMGQHLLAIVACPNWAHAYASTTTAAAWTYTDGNLTHFGGRATNVAFTGTPFGSTQPTFTSARTAMARWDYTLPAAPVTLTPAGFVGVCSTSASVGTGCTGTSIGASIHELFAATPDLIVPGVSSEDVLFVDAGGTVSVVTTPGTPIVAPASPNLGLGDDVNTPLTPIGFTATIGGRSFNSISMASNGHVWLGTTGAADWTPTSAEVGSLGARICPYWFDFAPNLGGSTHIDLAPGVAYVTWLNCWGFGGTGPEGTVQVEITPTTMRVRYDPMGGAWTSAASARLVGFSNGVAHTTPAPVDLNGGSVPPVTGLVSIVNPVLVNTVAPRVTLAATWVVTGLDPAGIGATVAEIGVATAPNPLPAPFGANCNQYVGAGAVVLALFINTATGSASIGPIGAAGLGLPVVVQSATIGGSAWASSNAVNNTFGM